MPQNDYINLINTLRIIQGDTWVMEFYAVDADGDAVSLAGNTATMQLRYDPEDADEFLELTSPSGGLVVDGAAGKVTATITAAQSAAFTPGKFYYGLRATNGGVRNTFWRGYGDIERASVV